MISGKCSLKAALAVAMAAGAISPAAASAMLPRPDPPQPAHPAPVQFVETSGHHGFDWGDAGIGAAAGLGLSMIATGGIVVAQRRGRHPARVSSTS